MRRTVAVIAAALLVAGVAMAQTTKQTKDEYPETLSKVADDFMQAFFSFQPSAGTRAGFHEFDSHMEDFSAERVQKQLDIYGAFEQRFKALDTKGWSRWALDDREMMLSFVQSRIFELQTQQTWRKNPDYYSAVLSDSAFLLMGRSFASPEKRLEALIEREKHMPKLLDEARQNLRTPPQIFTEIAIEQLPGIIDFFRKDVPSAFSEVHDAKLNADFQKSNAAVLDALTKYQDWLKGDLLARSTGDFRLGAENFRKKLQYEEMVDVPLDKLLQVGVDNLHRNQQEFQRVAKLIDPTKTPAQILASLEKDHPASGELLAAFRDKLTGIRDFCDSHKIITTPSRNLPTLEETPPFMRATTFASMDTPGPFEKKATEAFFNVTLPEKDWTPQQVEEHMAAFNWGVVTSTTIHEVIPGHYEQYLWNEKVPSRIRQFLSLDLSSTAGHFSGTNVEGWAHYTEQMMIDEGYGRTPGTAEDKDQAWLKLRLGQLQDALLRNARYVVAIQMHTGTMTMDEAIEFFQREGYQTKSNAVREVKRGTGDPTYLMYTLGKLQILKLREDLRARQGQKFNLQQFHDDFMMQGVAPVKVIRRAMLGDDSSTL